MNKINLVLAVFLALFLALPASAQVELGFIGGLNIANLNGKNIYFNGVKIDFSNRIALGVGAGVSFPTGSSSIFVEGCYVFGLTDVTEASTLKFMGKDVPFDEANVKTRGIQIMSGITFPLGGK